MNRLLNGAVVTLVVVVPALAIVVSALVAIAVGPGQSQAGCGQHGTSKYYFIQDL